MKLPMPLDDLALALQSRLDRLVRRLRLGRAPEAAQRRLLVVQIDGLSRAVLERALAHGHMPFLRRLLARPGFHLAPDVGRAAHLHAGVSDGRHVRRAAGHPGLPLSRQAAAYRRLFPAHGRRRGGGGAPDRRPPRHRDRRQRVRVRVHRRRGQQLADLHDAQAPLGSRAAAGVRRGHRAGVGDRQERGDLGHGDRARAARPGRRPGGRTAGVEAAGAQDRRVGVDPRAVHAVGLARPLWRRAGHLRQLPRLRHLFPRLGTTEPARAAGAAVRRHLDPAALQCHAARARASLRPLRALRPRAGPLHALRSADRWQAHRAASLRRVPDSCRRARGGARTTAGAGGWPAASRPSARA